MSLILGTYKIACEVESTINKLPVSPVKYITPSYSKIIKDLHVEALP